LTGRTGRLARGKRGEWVGGWVAGTMGLRELVGIMDKSDVCCCCIHNTAMVQLQEPR
jgi:hypothetical protein